MAWNLVGNLKGPAGDAGGLPAGVIVMWSGSVASIPAGWALCDGAGGRPDLRDRFVRGAAAGQGGGATGGSATHSHAAHTAPINHTHGVTVTDPGHVHVQGVNSATTGGLSGYTPDTSSNTRVNSGYSTSSATTGVTAATANPAGGVASQAHDSPNHEPPYFTVCFIIKT
jgi:hypothetical protein